MKMHEVWHFMYLKFYHFFFMTTKLLDGLDKLTFATLVTK